MAVPSSPAAPEVEAKLIVPRVSDLRAIARLRQVADFRLCPRGVAKLHSLYLDTAEHVLARHGVALRLRRHGGGWEATAKWAGEVKGTLHERPEINVALPAKPDLPFVLPAGPLHVQLAALVAGRKLEPILITDIERRLLDVLGPASETSEDTLAELALDRVRLSAPKDDDRSRSGATYCELEIELRRGTREQIVMLAQRLQRDFGLMPSGESKFARGLALLYGREPFVDRELRRPAPGDTVESAARHVVALHLARLRQNDPGTRLGEDPEAVHDMRVAVRRLRAAVRVFADGIPVRLHDALERDLRWLGRSLGAVRDLDVHLARFQQYRDAQPAEQRAAIDGLLRHLRSRRTDCRRELLAALDSPRYFRLLLKLERFAAARARKRPRDTPGQEPLVVAGRRALEQAVSKVVKRGRKVDTSGHTPTAKELHRLRIQAKRLRYLLEFLRELTGKPGRRFVKRLVRLQDLLGAHQDNVVAEAVVHEYTATAGLSADPAAAAMNALLDHEERAAAAARAAFHRSWRRFTQKRTPPDLREVLQRLRQQAAAPGPRRKRQ